MVRKPNRAHRDASGTRDRRSYWSSEELLNKPGGSLQGEPERCGGSGESATPGPPSHLRMAAEQIELMRVWSLIVLVGMRLCPALGDVIAARGVQPQGHVQQAVGAIYVL